MSISLGPVKNASNYSAIAEELVKLGDSIENFDLISAAMNWLKKEPVFEGDKLPALARDEGGNLCFASWDNTKPAPTMAQLLQCYLDMVRGGEFSSDEGGSPGKISIISTPPESPKLGQVIYHRPSMGYFQYDPVHSKWLSTTTYQFLFNENSVSGGRMRIGNNRLDDLRRDGHGVTSPITITGWSFNSRYDSAAGTASLFSSGSTILKQTINGVMGHIDADVDVEIEKILNMRLSGYKNIRKPVSVVEYRRRIGE